MGQSGVADYPDPITSIISMKECVALWTVAEPAEQERISRGPGKFSLREANGPVSRAGEGPLSGYSLVMNGTQYLHIPHAVTGNLNIHGPHARVTVVAWVNWSGEQTGFVGGMWNEHSAGGKRQYGLFVSLPHYNGANQVCGHISQSGKPTPPFPYSIDYSASLQEVPEGKWCMIAFTYDGEYIRSYFNGVFMERLPEEIAHTRGFDGYPEGLIQSKNPYYYPDGIGDNGSDFTVGAVELKNGMGNFFKGLLGGLAVFNQALPESTLKKLASSTLPE